MEERPDFDEVMRRMNELMDNREIHPMYLEVAEAMRKAREDNEPFANSMGPRHDQ